MTVTGTGECPSVCMDDMDLMDGMDEKVPRPYYPYRPYFRYSNNPRRYSAAEASDVAIPLAAFVTTSATAALMAAGSSAISLDSSKTSLFNVSA